MSIVLGLDTSHYQGQFPYDRAHAKGARFAGIQLTIGTGDDALGATNVKRALDAGLFVLPYHFTTGSASGTAQAAHFLDRVKALPSQERIYPIQDIEPKMGAKKDIVVEFFRRWFDWTPIRIGVYSGPGAFGNVMGRNFPLATMFPDIRLVWNADYRGPLVASPDDGRFDLHYAGSQFGYGSWSSAQIVQDGPRFGTDGDAFAGTEAQLAALFAGPIAPTPSVTYRYGAVPAWRGDWKTLANAPVRRGPGVGTDRITTMQPGVTFHVSQSLKRVNGRLWLGDDTGTRWVLADGRVRKA